MSVGGSGSSILWSSQRGLHLLGCSVQLLDLLINLGYSSTTPLYFFTSPGILDHFFDELINFSLLHGRIDHFHFDLAALRDIPPGDRSRRPPGRR